MDRLQKHPIPFLAGGGEMGALIRAHDWAATPLGPPAGWPQALKTAVRLLLSTGHPMFLWWGPELVQFYNDAYRRSIGPERHPSAIGQRGRECWEEIWPIIGPQIEMVMAGRGHTWHENQLVPITRHGRREDVYWTYGFGPIDDPSAPNGVGGVLVVCTETTEQVLAEQRMKAAEARWRALFEQAPGFVCILDGPRHVFEFASPAYSTLVGGRELVGRTLGEALPEVAEQGFLELLDEVFSTGEPHVGVATPVSIDRPDGTEQRLWLDFVYQPIRDAAGAVTGVFVAGYDVTERELAMEELRAEDRRKDEFLAMLAHELRNPLAPIRSASELLIRASAPERSAQELGELLARQVGQLSRLVDDLLDLSRITQDRIELQRAPLELGEAVRLAVEAVEPLLAEKQHRLVQRPSPTPLWVDGDRARIVQCIVNVLNNAIKFSEPGGEIRVELDATGGTAVVTVADEGHGIAPEMLEGIFELFAQAERSLDRSQGGLGIGLSLARRLLRMHGGDVTATSAGPGRGATFRLRLSTIASPPPEPARALRATAQPVRVLVVDDNVDAADSLVELLRIVGHEADAVYDARSALERATTVAPDVVLLDIGLPEMDGYEVARRLRARPGPLTLVALTGYGQAADVERARAAGFDAHLTKPLAFEALEHLLAQCVPR